MICSFSWEINVPIWYTIYPPVSSHMAGKSTLLSSSPRLCQTERESAEHLGPCLLINGKAKNMAGKSRKIWETSCHLHHPFADGKNMVMTWGWCEMATTKSHGAEIHGNPSELGL